MTSETSRMEDGIDVLERIKKLVYSARRKLRLAAAHLRVLEGPEHQLIFQVRKTSGRYVIEDIWMAVERGKVVGGSGQLRGRERQAKDIVVV